MPLVRQGGGRYDLACYVNYFTWIPPPPVTATLAGEFSYRDKKLGDSQPVTVATAPDVFQPTSTTVLLLRATRRVLVHGPRVWLRPERRSGAARAPQRRAQRRQRRLPARQPVRAMGWRAVRRDRGRRRGG